MKALNSTNRLSKAVLMTGVGMLFAFLFLAPAVVSATSYTLTLSTDKTSYNYGNTVVVSGTVTPAVSGTSVTLSIANPSGTQVAIAVAPLGSTGNYSASFVTGGTSNWVGGIYTVKATWAANVTGPAYTKAVNFALAGPTTTAVSGVNTTTYLNVTVTQQTTTTVVQQQTVTAATTTTVVQQTTVNAITTVTLTSPAADLTGPYALAIVGIIVGVVAIALVFLRKK